MKGANYPLVLDDGGRNLSSRPYQKNDCTVRAIAIACKLSYDTAYELLADNGRGCGDGFDLAGWISRKPKVARFKRMPCQGIIPSTFNCAHMKGRFLAENEDHVWAVIDGVHHDMLRVMDNELHHIWKVIL